MSHTLNCDHSLIRLLGNRLVMTHCQLELTLELVSGADKPTQAELLTRMRFWIDNVVNDCIALPMNRDYDVEWLMQLENPVMFCPDDPTDVMLQMLLQAKLHAIGQNLIKVVGSHLTTNLSQGFGMYFDGDPDELLPSNKTWMGPRAFYGKPWWHRRDAGMIDVVAKPEDDIRNPPAIMIDWEDLMPKAETQAAQRTAEIIRPAFKPRIITND